MGHEDPGYNSLENPIGIETLTSGPRQGIAPWGYNSLENPIGIETISGSSPEKERDMLQLIRKPDRDWNESWRGGHLEVRHELQLIRKPDRDWNRAWGIVIARIISLQLIRKPDRDWNHLIRPHHQLDIARYNSLENPIGIETAAS